jgi:hypothetical protein
MVCRFLGEVSEGDELEMIGDAYTGGAVEVHLIPRRLDPTNDPTMPEGSLIVGIFRLIACYPTADVADKASSKR